MNLVERESFLETLRMRYSQATAGEGHCVFICGEAGIGKTSLTKAFTQPIAKECNI